MRSSPSLVLALILAFAAGLTADLVAHTVDGSRYTCWSLPDVLRDLQARGVPVVFSSNVVREEMQVTSLTSAEEPHQLLAELLQPHGLAVVAGAGGRLLVIQDLPLHGQTASPWSAWSPPSLAPLLPDRCTAAVPPAGLLSALPAWVETGTGAGPVLVEHTIVGAGADLAEPLPLAPQTRCLVLRPAAEPIVGWEEIAFAIKTISVAARAHAENLAVALEASGEATRLLLAHDVAPYIDAYVLSQSAPLPAADPSGRWWWRVAADGAGGETVLHTLLRGAALGAELVLLDGNLDPAHRTFLQLIQALFTVDLDPQPPITGIAAEQARFLYDPHTGSYYLALYTEPETTYHLGFSLPAASQATCLFPAGATITYRRRGRDSTLLVGGDQGNPNYLILLGQQPEASNGDSLQVNGRRPVDPYEEVVRNQIYRARQARRLDSLDVMERRHAVSQGPTARQYTWLHRIIERRGHLTQYHHLGVLINGVPNPEGKLRIGRDFLAEASVELEPLEIELDRTYRYELLGEELIDGHATWKISFSPLLPGSFLAGTVWLDQETGARRQITAAHTGLRGPLLSREISRRYEWIHSNGQCFWTWTRSSGVSVSGTLRAWTIDTERYRFRYNRDDIEEEVAKANASDIPIHVAVPPDGHRWLVKKNHRRPRRQHVSPTPPASTNPLPPQHDFRFLPEQDRTTAAGEGSWGDRMLAGPGKYATTSEVYLRLRSNCTRDYACQDIGYSFHHQDLLSRGIELYAGFHRRNLWAHLTYPRLFGSQWLLHGSLGISRQWHEQIAASAWQAGGDIRATTIRMGARRVGIGAVRPLTQHLRFGGGYNLRYLDLSRLPDTDPGFTVPTSTPEHRGYVTLDLSGRRVSLRAGLSLTRRSSWQPWGWNQPGETEMAHDPGAEQVPERGLSEPQHGSYRQAWIVTGFATRFAHYQSLGAQVRVQKGWDLDHFSSFWAGSSSILRVAGFQPVSFQEGLGAVISYNRNLSYRLPLTLSLEAAALRSREGDGTDVNRLGLAIETILSGPLKTDIFLRVGYGLASSLPGEGGKLRSDLILSRRF